MASTDTCVLRTARLWDADMAANLLEEHGVPHYRRQETSGGLEFAMPASPAPAPGVWFTLWVPGEEAEAARSLLEALPMELDREPDVVDRGATPRNRRLIFLGAAIMLAMLLFGIGQQCANAIRELVNR